MPNKRCHHNNHQQNHRQQDQQDEISSVTSHVSRSSSGSGSSRTSARSCRRCRHTCSQHPIHHHIPHRPCERSSSSKKFPRRQNHMDHEMKWESLHPYCHPDCPGFWWLNQITGEIITIYEIDECDEKPILQPATEEQIIQGKNMLEQRKKQLNNPNNHTSTKTSTSTSTSTPSTSTSTSTSTPTSTPPTPRPLSISPSDELGRSHTNKKHKKRYPHTILQSPDGKRTRSIAPISIDSKETDIVDGVSTPTTATPTATATATASPRATPIPIPISVSNSAPIHPRVPANSSYQAPPHPSNFFPHSHHNPQMMSPSPFDMASYHPYQHTFNGRPVSSNPMKNINVGVGLVQIPTGLSHHHAPISSMPISPAIAITTATASLPLPSTSSMLFSASPSLNDFCDLHSLSSSSSSISSIDSQQDAFFADMMRYREMNEKHINKEDQQLLV